MTLLSVVKDVCSTVGVTTPTSVFSGISTNRTMTEMLSLANEMVQRIAYDTRDWTKMKKVCVLTGDGTSSSFNLPADFQRMLLTSSVWRSTSAWHPMTFVPDLDEWIQRRALNRINAWGEWTIVNGQMWIWPVLGVGITVTFPYIHRNCVALSSGGLGDSFMSDADTSVLDERVLKLGMIWQFKAQKGTAYAEDQGTYGDALTYAMGHDSPAPIILGSRPISNWRSPRVAYPFYPVP